MTDARMSRPAMSSAAPEPNGSGRSSGVRLLDRELARTYGPARRIGAYEVRERRSS